MFSISFDEKQSKINSTSSDSIRTKFSIEINLSLDWSKLDLDQNKSEWIRGRNDSDLFWLKIQFGSIQARIDLDWELGSNWCLELNRIKFPEQLWFARNKFQSDTFARAVSKSFQIIPKQSMNRFEFRSMQIDLKSIRLITVRSEALIRINQIHSELGSIQVENSVLIRARIHSDWKIGSKLIRFRIHLNRMFNPNHFDLGFVRMENSVKLVANGTRMNWIDSNWFLMNNSNPIELGLIRFEKLVWN